MHSSRTNVFLCDISFLSTALGVPIKVIDLCDNQDTYNVQPSTVLSSYVPLIQRQTLPNRNQQIPIVVAHTSRHYMSVLCDNMLPHIDVMKEKFNFPISLKRKTSIQQQQQQQQQLRLQHLLI